MVSACVLVRTERGKFLDVVTKLKQFKEAKNIFPVLGRYDAVVDLEVAGLDELGETVMRMGRMAGVVFTETLVEIRRKA